VKVQLAPARDVVEPLRQACAEAGFDLVQPLQVGRYNELVTGTLKLEDFGSASHLAIVIGNTRALWPKFLCALRSEPELLAEPHPLHSYTEQRISRAVSRLGQTVSVRWSHAGGKGLVAMQRLAQAAGLAYLAESQLSVHPTYGPWIALRAALSFALPGPPGPAPELRHPCADCGNRCRPAFERALRASQGSPGAAGGVTVEPSWLLWLACRDACPTGREHRYDEAQIRYHYLKDRDQLRRACEALPPPD
jgi:cyanocobalamin reductase (cyanide-eliminating) / alkylcobalamin dealkylase